MSRSTFALAALATVAIPGLEAVATRRIGATSYDVVEVLDERGTQWVVKAPRAAMLGAAMEGEVALLESLHSSTVAGPLPFAVPRPRGFAPLPEGGRAMVYQYIPGDPLNVARLAAIAPEVAGAISAIHALPHRVIEDAGMPSYTAGEFRDKRLAQLDEAAATGRVPAALLNRWEAACEDVRLWQFRPTVVHGDLNPESFLILSAKVVGIIDWASAHVGDPAADLAPLLAGAPESAMDVLLEAYEQARGVADPYVLARAVLASELALLRWLMHGIHTGSDDVIQDAVAMLAELDYVVADAEPIAEIGTESEGPAVSAERSEHAGTGHDDPGASGDDAPADDDPPSLASDGAHPAPVQSGVSPGSGAIPLGDYEGTSVGPDDDMPTVEIRREDLQP